MSSKKRMFFAIIAMILLLVCISSGCSPSRKYELKSVRVYDIIGNELKGPGDRLSGTILSDTYSIHDGTNLTFTYWGKEYHGRVYSSNVFWDELEYSNILSEAQNGYTTISYDNKTIELKFNCQYPLDNGTITFIVVVMNFKQK